MTRNIQDVLVGKYLFFLSAGNQRGMDLGQDALCL